MRSYTVTYVAESHDAADFFEEIVTCPNIEFVIPQFKEQIRVFKHITDINLIRNGNNKQTNQTSQNSNI